ncbi:hypothetical protein [Microbacterium kyungheense]|uniref:Ferredoxin-fold anticodon binding protein n=1 Tax=Microbacterium kyungheense TaxID=1263636 RepID=A0A543ES95_9MICO|nr:ferredoxin-fold anticodon binding protein [Microbacterium kyungheense]
MLRKGIPDIRYLRAEDPRIASQMLTLDPWQHVSPLPATRRDISVVLDAAEDEETLGDRIRTALGDEADVIESVEMLGRTAHEDLPDAARARLGTQEGQVNLLLRIVLRPIDRTLTSDQANGIRNAIYRAVHEGPVMTPRIGVCSISRVARRWRARCVAAESLVSSRSRRSARPRACGWT